MEFSIVAGHLPRIFPILWTLQPALGRILRGRPRTTRHVRGPAVRDKVGPFRPRGLLLAVPQLGEVLEVALRHLGLVLAAEDADLEVLDRALALGGFDARVFQVLEVLEDDIVGTDDLGDLLPRLVVGDELWFVWISI